MMHGHYHCTGYYACQLGRGAVLGYAA
jgi:hypothetical protein